MTAYIWNRKGKRKTFVRHQLLQVDLDVFIGTLLLSKRLSNHLLEKIISKIASETVCSDFSHRRFISSNVMIFNRTRRHLPSHLSSKIFSNFDFSWLFFKIMLPCIRMQHVHVSSFDLIMHSMCAEYFGLYVFPH